MQNYKFKSNSHVINGYKMKFEEKVFNGAFFNFSN